MVDKVKCAYKGLAICSGLLLFVLGIMSFLSLSYYKPIDVILPLYYLLFALFILDVEFGLNRFSKWFKLIQELRGRGIFYFLYGLFSIGTLCIRSHSIFTIFMAVLLMLLGSFYFYLSFKVQRTHEEQPLPPAGQEVKI